MCGRCCHDHSLPLIMSEAITWLEDGGKLALFCEGKPWGVEPPPEDLRSAHQKKRSFPVACGTSSARVTAILVGVISGACQHLGENLKCGIYERRPLVCRIYPAEISPFIQLNTSRKACPPEAWISHTILLSEGRLVDPHLQNLVEKSRQTDRGEALQKGLLCSELNINVAAIADEGFVAHEPDRQTFLDALRRAYSANPNALHEQRPWRLYSREPATLQSLHASGLDTISEKRPEDPFTLLHAPRLDG